MEPCKLAIYDSTGKRTLHTCQYVREHLEEMKKEYRDKNRVNETVGPFSIRRYKEYCGELEHFLDMCPCIEKISEVCEKCPREDHEGPSGMFCRCEMRNKKLANQLRKEGRSAWSYAYDKKENKAQAEV